MSFGWDSKNAVIVAGHEGIFVLVKWVKVDAVSEEIFEKYSVSKSPEYVRIEVVEEGVVLERHGPQGVAQCDVEKVNCQYTLGEYGL